ncbi:MAG TPA: DUF4919 domain-containing protein [Chitinophagaceae bacterium]|nr:DUF4919 domain-containing protein [Chitinophagaceae bacterium]
MKKIILLAGLLFCNLFLFSQKVSNIDFDAIKRSLDASPELYKNLIDRFKDSDITLTAADYITLYYGQCFQTGYSPYGNQPDYDEFKKHYQKQDYEKALPLAIKMLDKNPMDIQMTFKVLVCHHYLKDDENKAKINIRYENLLLTIIESGDGKTAATAMVVMRVSDEYELMNNMQVQNTSQTLITGPAGECDLMALKPNDLGLDKLYFNVSKLFESMSKMFEKKD